MADLIDLQDLTDRLGPNVDVDLGQAVAYITDVSSQIRQTADGRLDGTDPDDIKTDHPQIVAVAVSAIRRSLTNPDGFGSEMLDGYRYDQAPRGGVFLTAAEKRQVRSAVGMSTATVTLVSPYS